MRTRTGACVAEVLMFVWPGRNAVKPSAGGISARSAHALREGRPDFPPKSADPELSVWGRVRPHSIQRVKGRRLGRGPSSAYCVEGGQKSAGPRDVPEPYPSHIINCTGGA